MAAKLNMHPKRYSSIALHACPKCGGDLFRIPRRGIDRAASLFAPVQRYRCHFFSCNWEGNIRVSRGDLAASHDSDMGGIQVPPFAYAHSEPLPRSFIVHMVLAAAGLVAVLVVSSGDWLAPGLAAEVTGDEWIAPAKVTSVGDRRGPRTGGLEQEGQAAAAETSAHASVAIKTSDSARRQNSP